MSDQTISVIRWLLLAVSVLSLLQATVLHGFLRRVFVEPWFRMSERMGAQILPLMRDSRFQCGWLALSSVVFLVLWWLSGTPAGHAWLRDLR